jgi:retron-type reverse transcriptase
MTLLQRLLRFLFGDRPQRQEPSEAVSTVSPYQLAPEEPAKAPAADTVSPPAPGPATVPETSTYTFTASTAAPGPAAVPVTSADTRAVSPPAPGPATVPKTPAGTYAVIPPAPPPLPVPEPSADPYFAATPAATLAAKIKAKSTLGLDASAYLPITREEIKEAAKGRNLFGNAWFGRRDLIPPADDPRTKLIDRAMVTQGLLSPEQLREIHEVGALMDQIRPAFAGIEHKAALEGEAAVKEDREARARLKAQKKAEAAERKQRRADEVAHCKATDIVFLGRGVSGRLGDRRSNLDALAAAGLPALSTPADLAGTLGISVPKLRWLAFHNEAATRTHYVQFSVPKRSGGTRTLSAPHRSLAEAQRWVFREVVSKLPVEAPAHGFVAGRSIVSNAAPHCRRAVVVNMDLEGFFPGIGFPRVRAVFHRAGYSPSVATILALLCTECPRRTVVYAGTRYHVADGPRGLPQGACTSPGLSNQVARRLDKRLSGLAAKLDLTYTRYADDLTFSGGDALEGRVGYLMARVRHIARDEGFTVNEAKTRVLRQGTAQTVTGLVVNDRPGARRAEVRRLRAILHKARSSGLESQNREGRPDFVAWLRGKIAFVEMARPETGAKLRAGLIELLNK